MLGNDLSNDSPPMIYVTLDLITDWDTEEIKKRFRRGTTMRKFRNLNLQMAAHFDRVARSVSGVTFVCVSVDGEDLKEVEESLDARGLHVFRYFETFPSASRLARELAYLPNVIGVMDKPERALTWGSRYLAPDALNRGV